jgi:hypothetical protein
MSIRKVAPIEVEPEIVLIDWAVYEVSSNLWSDKTRHFVGYNVYGREGRVSSAINVFDRDKMVGITSSGRTYQLQGPPGDGSEDGLHVFDWWCERNEIREKIMVTEKTLE